MYITDTDGNESESEEEIMSEDEDADNADIDRESVNRTTKTISGRVVIPSAIMKGYETVSSILDIYEQAVTLTSDEDNFNHK